MDNLKHYRINYNLFKRYNFIKTINFKLFLRLNKEQNQKIKQLKMKIKFYQVDLKKMIINFDSIALFACARHFMMNNEAAGYLKHVR